MNSHHLTQQECGSTAGGWHGETETSRAHPTKLMPETLVNPSPATCSDRCRVWVRDPSLKQAKWQRLGGLGWEHAGAVLKAEPFGLPALEC